MTDLTAVSLFAGVGGFDLAMERNGINVVATVEIDKNARGVLQHQFPNTQHFTDVTTVTGEDLRNAGFIPEHGIITGGFPCQDLSVAGKRAGLVGARSGLFYEIARIADETKAKWLVLENVPGLLSSQRGADMGAVIGTLVELGYGVAWRVLDAQHFGVPQRRRRVFIVAERAGDPTGPAEVLFKRQSLRGDSSTSGTPREEVAGDVGQGATVTGALTAVVEPYQKVVGTITAGANPGSYNGQDAYNDMFIVEPIAIQGSVVGRNDQNDVVVGPLTATGMSRARGTETVESNHFVLENPSITAVVEPIVQTWPIDDGREIEKHQNGLGIGNDGDPAYTLDRSQHSSVATVVIIDDDPETLVWGGAEGIMSFTSSNYSALAGWEKPVYPTINASPPNDTAGLQYGIRLRQSVRRLTPMECERLQGFPDGWTSQRIDEKKGLIEQADSSRYKQMGNAVAVPCVEWIMACLVEQDNGR